MGWVFLAAVPPVMDPLKMPEEVPRRRLLRDRELDVPLRLSHLLLTKLNQDRVLHLFIDVDYHLDPLPFFFDEVDLRHGLDWDCPLQGVEMWFACLGVKPRVRVHHEHLRYDEESLLE